MPFHEIAIFSDSAAAKKCEEENKSPAANRINVKLTQHADLIVQDCTGDIPKVLFDADGKTTYVVESDGA